MTRAGIYEKMLMVNSSQISSGYCTRNMHVFIKLFSCHKCHSS